MSIERSTNVYEALGFANPEEMKEKARLTHALTLAINDQKLTRLEAATRLGMTEIDLNALLRGDFRGLEIRDIQLLLARIDAKQGPLAGS